MKHKFRGFLFANLSCVVDWLSKFVFLLVTELCLWVVDTAVRIFLVFVHTAGPTVHKIILLCILYCCPEDGGVETCCQIEGVTLASCADVSLFPSL